MFRLRKSTKYIIIIVIIGVAVYFAARLSDIQNIFSHKITVSKIDDIRAETVFENAGNDKKIKLLYTTPNLKEFNFALQNIYGKYGINPQYANDTQSYYVSVFDFPDSLSDKIMTELRGLERLNQEFLDSADPEKFKINIEDHIKNKERVKRTLENKIDNAVLLTEDRITKYNENLTNIQLEIDSLRNQQKIFNSLVDNKLVYVASLYQDNSQQITLRTRRINMVKNFLLYFLIFLIISILLLIVANYFVIMLFKLMQLLGIKTSRSSSGGYSYGGNSYKSRYYYRRPKKVKKIYKDEDGNVIKQKVTKE
ncbi:MAG: hypothetical protein K9M99_00630 [Candidatus Cloacimonetes bacterium]|nr:hypothetical protein [Candidatus Cloacimonadota bacterium]